MKKLLMVGVLYAGLAASAAIAASQKGGENLYCFYTTTHQMTVEQMKAFMGCCDSSTWTGQGFSWGYDTDLAGE